MGFLIPIIRRKFKQFRRKIQEGKSWLRGRNQQSPEEFTQFRLAQTKWVMKKCWVEAQESELHLLKKQQKFINKLMDTVEPSDIKNFPTDDKSKLSSLIHQAGHTVQSWKGTQHLRLNSAVRETKSTHCFTHSERNCWLGTVDEVVAMIAMHIGGCVAERLCLKTTQTRFCRSDLLWITVYSRRLAAITKEQLERSKIDQDEIDFREECTPEYWVEKGFEVARVFLEQHIDDVMKVARGFVETGSLYKKELTHILGPQNYEPRVDKKKKSKK